MSLLNDVLEDLGARGQHPPRESRTVLSGLVAAPATKRGAQRFGWMAGVLCAAIVAAVWWRPEALEWAGQPPKTAEVSTRPPPMRATLQPGEVAAAGAATAPVDDVLRGSLTAATPPLPPVELDDIHIETSGRHTRMRFALSRSTDYWIEGDDGLEDIEIVLSGTRLSSAVPPLDLQGTSISEVEARESLLGLHILLHLDRSTRIQSQMLSDRRTNELVIDLLPAGERKQTSPAAREWTPEPFERSVAPETLANATADREPAPSQPVLEITRSRAKIHPAEAAYRGAREHASLGRLEAAEQSFERALELDPDHLLARESLATLLIQRRRLSEAESRLADGLARTPGHVPFTLLRARALDAAGEPERAIVLLQTSSVAAARPPGYDELLGSLLQRSGRSDLAASAYRRALRRDSENGRLWLGLGLALDAQGRRAEALRVYHTAQMTQEMLPGPRQWLEGRIRELESAQR